jgi:PAS domain S-box-containing protein
MKNEPAIVKELRQAEKLGLLKYELQGNLRVDEEEYNKEKNAKIKKTEEIYKNLFAKAIDPMLIIDKKGKFVDINDQVVKLLKYNKKDLIGKDFNRTNIFTRTSIKKVQDNFLNRMECEHGPPYKIEVITKTGNIIPVKINTTSISEYNTLTGYLITLKDLRESYKKEKNKKEIDAHGQKFKYIFEGASDLFIYIEKGIIVNINKATTKLLNIKKHEVIGKKILILKNFFNIVDSEKHINAIDLATTCSEVTDYETEIITNNGVKHDFLFSVDCIYNDKKIRGVLLQGKDITQRNHELKQLVKLKEKYRVLTETSADGIITIDPLGRITYLNPSFEKMLNRRKSQILTTLLREYLSEDSIYLFQQIFIEARKKEKIIENVELDLVHSSGKKVPIEVNIASFKKDGEFAGIVLTIRDITEHRKIEDELKKSDKLKTEFMNIAAHELKSPVTPIKGYLDLIISDKDANEKIKNWAKISLRNSERLLKLVNDILDVSRLETDTMRFDIEKISIVDILDEIVEDMKPSVEGKGLKFITDIPRDLPYITGDKFRITQVFKNLLVNAIKFTDSGSITIIAKQKKEHILISLTDSGVGINKDDLKKIFNKFYQAYTGDDRKHEGTGLGLFICRNIIQKHNGKIWTESQVGKGSTFYIEIPYIHKMVVNLKK